MRDELGNFIIDVCVKGEELFRVEVCARVVNDCGTEAKPSLVAYHDGI